MTWETWLTFALAYLVLSIIPGPSVLMVAGQALSRGLGVALFCILGDLAGGVIIMTLSYAGLGLILAQSAEAYALVKWAGIAYMAWLGLTQLRAAYRLEEKDLVAATLARANRAGFRAGFVTGVLNPKAILFYVAFLAQFIDPSQESLPQFLILMATSSGIVFLVLGAYALLAAQARKAMTSLKARKRMGYAGGGCLLGGSAWMATTR